MMKPITFLLTFLIVMMQGVCAQTVVKTENELREAFVDGANIQLGADITLTAGPLTTNAGLLFTSETYTIDLNGHSLGAGYNSQIFRVENRCKLNVSNGTLKEGKTTGNGGAITFAVPAVASSVSLTDVILKDNHADDSGGAIFCPASTIVELMNCTFTKNRCANKGAGIYAIGSIIYLDGKDYIEDNTTYEDAPSNVFLAGGSYLCLRDSWGKRIGVGTADDHSIITKNYGYFFDDEDPNTMFKCDYPDYKVILLNGEVVLSGPVDYVERSWNEEKKIVEATDRQAPAADLLGILNKVDEGKACHLHKGFYFVDGKLSRKDVELICSDSVSIILCDNSSLELKSLNIKYKGAIRVYAQKNGNGQMILKSSSGDGIGLWEVEAYSIGLIRLYIHGGVIKTEGVISGCRIPLSMFGGQLTAKGTGYAGVSGQYGDIYIYGGTINATGGVADEGKSVGCAGIGGSDRTFVYIYGGEITARGGDDSGFFSGGNGGAGIGGNSFNGGRVVIEGGKVTAFGGYGASGIGNGWAAPDQIGEVTIRGGDIYAYGGKYAAGIGSGRGSDGYFSTPLGHIEITGGTVHAYGGTNAPGIGGWNDQEIHFYEFYYNKIYISGGEVFAYAGDDAAGIGGGPNCSGGNIKITGGKVYAYAYQGSTNVAHGAGIGGGYGASGGNIQITDAMVYAYGGENAAGIGGGQDCITDDRRSAWGTTITISNSNVYAQGEIGGAGIGLGNCSGWFNSGKKGTVDPCNITISESTVVANGGSSAAGVGGGSCSPVGTISISNSTVIGTGGMYGAGIGKGWKGTGGNIIIKGESSITANGGHYAAGIGGGKSTDGDIIKIEGGKIRAIGGIDAAGIGTGEEGDSCDITITGGSIYAEGSGYGCGVGTGRFGRVKSIKLLGGSIEAQAGDESTARAIGSVVEEYHGMDNVTLGDLQKAMYNLDGKWTTLPVNDRKMCVFKYQHAIIAECEHQGIPGTPLDANQHYKDCPYCKVATKGGVDHTFDDPRIPGYCTGCGIICVDANADNSGVLAHWDNRLQNKVGLSNYTLHTDGRFNIVTLPFALNEDKLAASCLKDATIKQLGYTKFEEESGTLKVHFEKAYSMKAGQPYVVVWDTNENTPDIKNPVFELVTPTTEENPNTTTYMDFIGSHAPYALKQDDATRYVLSESGEMEHPLQDTTLVAFRGFFQLAKVAPEQVLTMLIDGLKIGDDTGIETIQAQDGQKTQKFIRNGVLYIRKGGRFYDAAGREVSQDAE